MLHTTGELFLSPIGLSMVTKLAPKNIAGTAMGGWFLSFAIANYAGGLIATLTGGHGHGSGGEESTEVAAEASAGAEEIVTDAVAEAADTVTVVDSTVVAQVTDVADSAVAVVSEVTDTVVAEVAEIIEAIDPIQAAEAAKAGLEMYTGVFSTIGWVLVGFAILIALCSKPLNKLMHGVK